MSETKNTQEDETDQEKNIEPRKDDEQHFFYFKYHAPEDISTYYGEHNLHRRMIVFIDHMFERSDWTSMSEMVLKLIERKPLDPDAVFKAWELTSNWQPIKSIASSKRWEEASKAANEEMEKASKAANEIRDEASSQIKNSSLTIPLRINEEPLTPQTLATAFTALTELTTKLWLIANHRFADLIEYTQTHDTRFANEAGSSIAYVTYNSPFSFGLNFDLSATNVADGTMTIVNGLSQRKAKREQLEISNQAALQKIEGDEQKSELERTREQLAIERERVALLRETMEVQKIGIEYALELADKAVDIVYPNADAEMRPVLIQTLVNNILQLETVKGLELILPMPKSDDAETKQNAGQ